MKKFITTNRIALFWLLIGMQTAIPELASQENVTTLGIQLRPIIPSKYFGTGTENVEDDVLKVKFEPNLGWNFGMIVRKGLSRNWSLETGICLARRNFTMTFDHPGLKEPKEMRFAYICYEVPVQGIIFVKLGEELYMNAGGGLSFDLYPSNIETSTYQYLDTNRYDFYQKTYRNGWIQLAMLASYGFEWRTKSSGFFYLGASYHRPMAEIGTTSIVFEENTDPLRVRVPLRGNYLTADFRYFFHEKPERRKPKT